MSKTKFTPGPWQLCAHLKNINEEVGCSCGYRGVVYGPEDIGYAICQPGHEAYEGEEGLTPPRYDRMTEIANMHLIAAAPDLYEALEEALRVIGEHEYPITAKIMAKALAKARGEK